MRICSSLPGRALLITGLTSWSVACGDKDFTNVVPPSNSTFAVAKLVSDQSGAAATVDANLVNAWGLAFGPTGVLWVNNAETGTSTTYDASGAKGSLVVTIPTSDAATGGAPTGIAVNSTGDFVIPGSGAALFIFAGEDGVISAWNPSLGTAAKVVADRSSNDAVYKGLAIVSNGGANFLFATNFKNNAVDVFDGSFQFVKSFTDPNVPAGYAPFGIHAAGSKVYVTFAKQEGPDNEDDEPGAGNGFVDVFNTDGTLASRFASNGSLNSPWAIAVAPAGFGSFGGDVLIGNFGDGRIGVYDPNTGAFIDVLRDADGAPITIDGLWGLTFGPASSTTLYFAAGPNDETHGLVGTVTPR